MIRFVILDVEGVIALPGGSQHPWPLEEMLAIRRFLRQSPLACGLCTGRQEPYGEAVVQALDLFFPLPEEVQERVRSIGGPSLLAWPSILENGAYLYDPIAKTPLPHPALTAEHRRVLRQLVVEALEPLAARTGALIEAGKDLSVSLNPPLIPQGAGARETTESFRPQVDAAVGAFAEWIEVKHSHSAIDITARGISKASAVRQLLDWTGLRPDEVLGVGDTQADEAWLQEVGWRAAPSNGREALPGMHYYSPFPVASGLLEILEQLRSRDYRGIG